MELSSMDCIMCLKSPCYQGVGLNYETGLSSSQPQIYAIFFPVDINTVLANL